MRMIVSLHPIAYTAPVPIHGSRRIVHKERCQLRAYLSPSFPLLVEATIYAAFSSP
jgi:hypothetical protein